MDWGKMARWNWNCQKLKLSPEGWIISGKGWRNLANQRKGRGKRRKFAKLVNWGETISSQEEEDHLPVGRVGNMEDWVTEQEMEKEE